MLHIQPFRYRIIDGLFDPSIIRSAAESWPDADWPHWILYDSAEQTKKTCNVPFYMPVAVRQLTSELLAMPVGELLGLGTLIPDPSLHAGGMHRIWPGGSVGNHLDADSHPLILWTRRANAILYVNQCDGGELMLGNECSIEPRPGRLVLFECSDKSFHGVLPVTAGCRSSIMSCWWSVGTGSRLKAEFSAR